MANINIEEKDGKLTIQGLKSLMILYSDALFLFVNGIVKNSAAAEELVSDVFVKIWSKRSHFSEIHNIRSYLYILARNESISFIRKNIQVRTVSLDDLGDYFLLPLESDGSELFGPEIMDKINAAIELLPPKCKMAFSLAKINGLKYKEIAEIMQISPLTVKNHISYALEKICDHLGVNNKDSVISRSDVLLFFLTAKKSRPGLELNVRFPFF